MLRLDRLQTSCMFQELVLIVAGTAQVPDDIIGALVDLDELLTLLERHAATGVASNAPQAGLEIGTEIGQLFTLCGEAQVGGGLQNLQLLRAFCQLLMTALFRFNVRGVNCKWGKKSSVFYVRRYFWCNKWTNERHNREQSQNHCLSILQIAFGGREFREGKFPSFLPACEWDMTGNLFKA